MWLVIGRDADMSLLADNRIKGGDCSGVYPGVYPPVTILLILLGKISVAETNEQNPHRPYLTLYPRPSRQARIAR